MSLREKHEPPPPKSNKHAAGDNKEVLRKKLLEMIKRNEALRQAKPR